MHHGAASPNVTQRMTDATQNRLKQQPLSREEIRRHNADWTHDQFRGMLPLRPARQTAVVACMDSRMPIFGLLGLEPGDAHIIRNAGGIVTDDVLRSLILSQRAMGTTSIVLIQHTDCGLTKISEDTMRAELEAATGLAPQFSFETFRDPWANVRQSIRRLRLSPFLLHRDAIIGFVYDVGSGRLNEVSLDAEAPSA